MSLTVNQRPSTTISGETSKWNAVGNPVLYKMTRKDFTFNQVNDNGGFVQLQFNGVDITGSFANNDSLYVQSDNGVYDDFGTQTAEAFSGGNTLITTDIAYVSAAPGGFCNNDSLRPLYRVEVEVYNAANVLLNESPFVYSPTSRGALTIDVAAILRAQLLALNSADLTGSTEVFDDTNVYLQFYIKYREVWTGSAESQTNDSANKFFAALASRQIPAPFGGNLAEYVVNDGLFSNPNFETNLTPWTHASLPANFDTFIYAVDGAREIAQTDPASGSATTGMKYFQQSGTFDPGYYTLHILVENDTNPAGDATSGLVGVTVVGSTDSGSTYEVVSNNGGSIVEDLSLPAGGGYLWKHVRFKVSKTYDRLGIYFYRSGSGVTSAIAINLDFAQFTLSEFLTRFDTIRFFRGYSMLLSAVISELQTGNIYLEVFNADRSTVYSTTPANYGGKLVSFDINEIITDQTPDTLYARLVEVSATEEDEPISEVKTIELVDHCSNPIMLMARNSLGGVLQWLFDVNQEYTFDYGNGRKAKRLVLTTVNLTINQWEALQDFITLGEVYRENIVELTSSTDATSRRIGQQVYVVNADGTKIGVIALPTRNATRTKQIKHIFELEIEYPEEFAT